MHRYSDVGLLVLRVVIGAIFLYHGILKWGVWSAPAEGGMQIVMKILSVAEPLGGLALILGFWTPLAALGLAIIMLGAIYVKTQVWGLGFAGTNATGWEFDLVLLAGNIVLITMGAGKYALGAMMKK